MFNQDQIQQATIEELQNQLKFFQRDIRHTESWLQELKRTESMLKTAMADKGKTVTSLKKQILKRGLKQKTLAKKIGISEAAVSLQVKTGIKMAKVATKYAKAMNCDPRLLIDF
jgi:predicted XRE-type DNA-binding protein